MAKLKKELEGLNHLLESYLDAKNTYVHISEEEHNLDIKRFYNTQITLRNKFVNDLTGIIRSLGGKPRVTSVIGSVQRNFSDIVSSIIQLDSKKALNKSLKKDGGCITIANELIKNSELPNEIIATLFSQRSRIIEACETAQDFLVSVKNRGHMKVVGLNTSL
ncbi:DUF2383 domain-containing protein [Sungkyunkwania multivorans]|uniref:DUF2383 domain-containing protein n=1 Tax=Sungkyunkwania multivorans TaxID=1173618 RepID=A0ABW3CZB6_9FLAO